MPSSQPDGLPQQRQTLSSCDRHYSHAERARQAVRRCRGLGLKRYRIQALLTFLVNSTKRILKLLTGLTIRPLAKGRRAEVFTPVYGTLQRA